MKPILWLGVAVTIAVLGVLVLRSGDRAGPPGAGPERAAVQEPTRAAEPERELALPAPPSAEGAEDPSIDPAEAARRERLANDPIRIETAERTLAGFEGLFLDPTPLEAVGPGDIHGRIEPKRLGQRRMALSALDSLLAQPENAGPIHQIAVRVLGSVLRQPWPTLATPEAETYALEERGHALASLLKADPDAARAAYHDIPGSELQEQVARSAVSELVRGGMEEELAQARVAGLGD